MPGVNHTYTLLKRRGTYVCLASAAALPPTSEQPWASSAFLGQSIYGGRTRPGSITSVGAQCRDDLLEGAPCLIFPPIPVYSTLVCVAI